MINLSEELKQKKPLLLLGVLWVIYVAVLLYKSYSQQSNHELVPNIFLSLIYIIFIRIIYIFLYRIIKYCSFNRAIFYTALEYFNKYFILFQILYFVSLLIIFKPTYLTNDDVAILWNIEKGFPCVYFSVLMGKILSYLYLEINSNIPWYSMFLYLVSFISLALFTKALISLNIRGFLLLPLLLISYSLYIPFILHISYNTTSILIGSSSILTFLVYIGSPRKSISYIIFLGFLFTSSYLIRTDAIVAILVFSLPIIFFFCFSVEWKKNFFYCSLFVLPLFLVIPINFFVEKNNTTIEYKKYSTFNELRGKIHSFPIQEYNKENNKILQSNKWSENDFKVIFDKWIFINEKIFNINTLNNFFKYAYKPKISFILNKNRLIELTKKGVRNYFVYLALFIIILMFSKFNLKKVYPVFALMYSLFSILFIIWMALFLRFPDHIGHPLYFSILFLLIYIISTKFAYDSTYTIINKRVLNLVTLLCFFMILISINVFRLELKYNEESKKFYRYIELFQKEDVILFSEAQWMRIKYLNPLKTNQIKFKVIPLSWSIYSPRFYEEIKSNLNIEKAYDIIPSFINKNNAYIVCDDQFTKILRQYIKEHYNLHVNFKVIRKLNNGKVFRLYNKSTLFVDNQKQSKNKG